jgi:hypothetical protein
MTSGPESNSFGGLVQPPALKSFGSFGKPPALGISRPQVGLKKPSTDSEVFEVKQEWSGASKSSTWDIKGEDLEMVPWEFPLERTHREIREGDGACVAQRISESLRALSVEAEFCSGPVKAKCKTADYVHFRIRLFAGGENGQPVVVEVQRRSGSAGSFLRTCRAILDAAEGNNVEEVKAKASNRCPPFLKKPVSSLKCLSAVMLKQHNSESEASTALDGALDMLRSEQRDSNILGLENMCVLTDPIKTNPLVSLQVSKSIILGAGKYDIREEIRLLTERDVFTQEFGKEEASHGDLLRSLALGVLANALSMCSNDGSLAAAMKEQHWFSEYLIPSLVDELKRAETSMNDAYQAASCLHSMMVCSVDGCKAVVDNGAVSAFQKANQVGEVRHELLANETSRCLKAIHTMN